MDVVCSVQHGIEHRHTHMFHQFHLSPVARPYGFLNIKCTRRNAYKFAYLMRSSVNSQSEIWWSPGERKSQTPYSHLHLRRRIACNSKLKCQTRDCRPETSRRRKSERLRHGINEANCSGAIKTNTYFVSHLGDTNNSNSNRTAYAIHP